MKRIPGHILTMVCCTVVLAGWSFSPVAAVLCDGPPNSQSFILFTGGCDRSSMGLPCTQGFIFPAQPSPGGDFPTQYYLDFGDGSPPYYGTVDGVTHTYTAPGLFTLDYRAGTQCDLWRKASFVLNVSAPPNYTPVLPECQPTYPSADFTAEPTSGFAPLTVRFTSTSTGVDAYAWRFGDGGTSPAQDPAHTYRTPGTYSVSLEARDSCTGSMDRSDKLSYVTVSTTAGTLAISSTPPGAMVFIDNVVKGITPVTLTDTAIGSHQIIIRKEGYEDYLRTIIIETATPATLGVTLTKTVPEPTTLSTPSYGSLAITSFPSGAEIFLDGSLTGTTPAILPGVVTGNHEITLSLRGYDTWSHIVSVGSGQMAAVNAELDAIKEITGSLAVTSDPSGAEIYIDGKFKGVSPATITGISAGTHVVVLTLEEYANNTTSISVTAGETLKYTTVLQKVFRPSAIDWLFTVAAIVIIGIVALIVMFRNDKKPK